MDSVETLRQTLDSNGINTSLYGEGCAKSLQQLFNEIRLGESVLMTKDGKLTRNIHIMTIYLFNKNKVLIEWEQKFHPTRDREEFTRSRYISLAEKYYPHENKENVLTRALKEELGIDYNHKGILNITECNEIRNSNSYPELETHYHCVSVFIDTEISSINIPDDFVYTEYFDNGDPRLTTTWKWLTKHELQKYNNDLYHKVSPFLI